MLRKVGRRQRAKIFLSAPFQCLLQLRSGSGRPEMNACTRDHVHAYTLLSECHTNALVQPSKTL